MNAISCSCENLGEARVLGQKAIAGMDGVRAGDLASRHDRRNVKIAVARGRRADADALVGELDVHRVLVGSRIDATVAMPSSLAARMTRSAISPRFAMRILSNIEGRASVDHSITISGWSYSTGEPSATRMLTTLPARGATMSLKVFIASTSSSLSPVFTTEPTSTKGLASGLGRK